MSSKKHILNDIYQVFWFGKYRWIHLIDVLEHDPRYIIWLQENSEMVGFTDQIINIAKEVEKGFVTITDDDLRKLFGGECKVLKTNGNFK